ncbi:MAG: hypothetical protein AUG79_03810 [Gemmatimonadetes bacterium 13_1_20CM_4_69_16]|nr:MAG: hypothetical protein AUG79_03810 [Gemmatimonadetes bacterium 13_1_20CM_4_69_16]
MSDVPDRLSVALADRYVLERELGRGGMATVYLARDVRHRRAVAVKVLRPELAAVLGPERFLREIEVAAQLNHPHILQLYDSGEAGGFLYYVMPLVDGESLRDRLERERQLPVEDALQIVREVADALAFAHSRRVVHRDVKPENILLAGGHAVIADFGIARAVTAAGGERLTQTGVSLGTPAYMSPEQWAGDEGLDGRSDLYSLGCVLYETLMGEPPFAGSSPQVILARQSMERIPSIRLVRPNVPPAVEAAITRAIAKLPADRFATTLQFAEALVAAPAAPSPEAAARPVPSRPFRRRAAAGVAIGVLLLGGTLGGLRLRSRATATGALVPGRVVVGQLENRTGDSTLNDVGSMAADWITQGLQSTGLVDVIPSPTALQASRFVAQQAPAGRRGGGRDPIAALAQETGAGTVISGAFYRDATAIEFHVQVTAVNGSRPVGALDPVRGDLRAPGDAIVRLRDRVLGLLAVSLDERFTASRTESRPPTFEAYREFSQGLDAYVSNAYHEALPHFSRAFRLDSSFALALLYTALCHSNLEERAQADSVTKVLARFRDRLTDYDRDWLDYLRAQFDGDHERALRAIRRAAEIAPGSKAAYNVAYVALQTNRPREALHALQTLDPERGPMRGWFPYWDQLTDAWHREGDHAQELQAARRARQLFPDRLKAVEFEAEALAAMGRVSDLGALLDPLDTLGARDVRPGTVLTNVADELRTHGQFEQARRIADRAVHWFQRRPSPEAATEGHRAAYAGALDAAGRWREAEAIVRALDHDFPARGSYRGWLGVLAARRGDRPEAARISQWLASRRQPYQYGLPTLQRARIAALLGDRDRTVTLLQQAFDEGLAVPRHMDWNFESVFGYLPFQNLMKPRD